MADSPNGHTPTQVVSHALLTNNRGGTAWTADSTVITPTHNPPEDEGLEHNPSSGGPPETGVAAEIENPANRLPSAELSGVRRAACGGSPYPPTERPITA